jgi:hypothetical protein
MALVFGVAPSVRGGLALGALYWQGKAPASLIVAVSVPSVDEALSRIVGTTGEWGELQAVGIASPLTWSGSPAGVRHVDKALKKRLPKWAPRTWVRGPLNTPSSTTIQGPALTWGLATEIRHGQLPHHAVIECSPKLSLTRLLPDSQEALLGYAGRSAGAAQHVRTLLTSFVSTGILRLETEPAPTTAFELDALVCALTSLGVAAPDSGIVTHELQGGDLRPVGKRPVVVLEALP